MHSQTHCESCFITSFLANVLKTIPCRAISGITTMVTNNQVPPPIQCDTSRIVRCTSARYGVLNYKQLWRTEKQSAICASERSPVKVCFCLNVTFAGEAQMVASHRALSAHHQKLLSIHPHFHLNPLPQTDIVVAPWKVSTSNKAWNFLLHCLAIKFAATLSLFAKATGKEKKAMSWQEPNMAWKRMRKRCCPFGDTAT